jgi:monothiol glutaredoxin
MADVKPMTPTQLLARKGEVTLFDVRPTVERARASIDWARPFDADGEAHLLSLPKDAPVVFLCHHGIRSRRAAEDVAREGYTDVYNLEGGIEAWSRTVDPNVPRY